jgi:iron complex outermembrane recepter protein
MSDSSSSKPPAHRYLSIGTAVRQALQFSALATLAAAGTIATAADTADTADSDQTLTEVVVTGSRISRTDSETPSPVQIVTEAEIKESGYTSVSQVLQNLTANGQGTLSSSFPGAFAGSATGISLRGLNTSATLVLIDGHRMAPFPLSDDGQRSFVDVSSIPFDAVERIEVLKDGASAVYGSDAMAGVVNIILKNRYVGTTFTAEAGTSTEGGGTTEHLSAMHGMGDLDTDGYNAYVNIEYRHQDDILQRQRQGDGLWSNLNQTDIGGISQVPGMVSPIAPTPPTYGGTFLTPLTGAYSAANSDFVGGSCTFAKQAAGACAFTNPHAEIQPRTQNLNLLASFKKKLGDNWLLDVKGSVFADQGEQFSAGNTANGLVVYPTVFNPLVAVDANTLPHVVGTTIPAVTVPATYPGNTLGAAAKVRGVSLDGGALHTDFDNHSYRFVVDLTGSVLGIDVDTSAGYTRVNTETSQFGLTDTPVLNALLNNPTAPWLINGGNTPANIAAVYPIDRSTDTSTLYFAELNLSKSLMKLQGGNLGVSAGGQFIRRDLDAPAPPLAAQGIVAGNNAFVLGSQTDTAAYAEFAAPIFTMLELDGHVRFDHFNNAGNATTPSFGFKFTPVKQLAFRGTWGRGFRAPNAAENGKAGQAYSAGTGADPILCSNGNPATVGNVISQCNFNVVYENSANPNLKPEKSTSETLGLIFEPIKSWSTTLDFYQVKITNQIVAGTGDIADAVRGGPLVETCAGAGGTAVPCTTSVGEIIYIPVEYVNANSTKVNGFEVDSQYKINLGEFGTVTPEIDWTHMMSYIFVDNGVTSQLAGTHGPAVIGGNTGNPKDRVQASFTWDNGPLSVRTTVNYISSFSLTDPSGSNAGTPVLDCADGVQFGGYFHAFFPGAAEQPTQGKYCRVQQFIETDVSASYMLSKHLSVHGSVLNVFNAQPPLDLNTYGGGNLPYNPSMHQAGAVGRFINVGFKLDL